MELAEWTKYLKYVPLYAVEGCRLWIQPPTSLTLLVKHIREEGGNAEFLSHARKIIQIEYLYREDGKAQSRQVDVVIDLETRRIDDNWSTDWLFGKQHMGSGALGLALMTLPITLPLSPLLIAANQTYQLLERARGMSRYGWTLLQALKGQLDTETEALLTDALRNTWRHERELSRRVTLEQAKAILSEGDLKEVGLPQHRACHWFKDGDEIAVGLFELGQQQYVNVLGSMFYDEEARALLGYCRTREYLSNP